MIRMMATFGDHSGDQNFSPNFSTIHGLPLIDNHPSRQDHNFNSLLFGSHLLDDNNNNSNARHLLECYQMIEWTKEIPYYSKLPMDDRVALLKSAWNELLIAAFSHR